MAIQRPSLSKLTRLWEKTVDTLSRKKSRKPDNREYTLMIVPHQGEAVIRLRIPIKAVRYSITAACVIAIATTGLFINYRQTVKTASIDKTELSRLREVTTQQYAQLEQLAQKTAVLQEDMSRLNALDTEIRRIVNTEESSGTSRSGMARPAAKHNGQGGPVVQPSIDQLDRLMDDLQATAKAREKSLSELKTLISERNARLAVTPSIWPTNGDVTSRFGWRGSPWGWGSDWHPGIDIANDQGTAIVATANGKVVRSGWYGGYGKAVEIDHGNGIVTLYGHNSELVAAVGKWVKKGEIIAYMGNTGVSTGPHLHYEVRVNGTAVNPANFL